MALPLLALPWLARVLGSEAFGLLMYACLVPPLTALFMDWGLSIGGTRETALARCEKNKLRLILAGYFSAKIILTCTCLMGGAIIWFFLPHDLVSVMPYSLALGLGIARSLNPAWFFQGTGSGMPRVACWDVGATIAALLLIVLLIKKPEQWPLYLVILLGTKFLAYIWILGGLWRTYRPAINFRLGLKTIKQATPIFGGPFGIMICYNGTQLILGYYLTATEAGVLGATTKILRALASLVNPFTQTLFPELCILGQANNRDSLHIFKWSLGLAFAGGLGLTVIVWILAPGLISIALGSGYAQAPNVLRILLIALPFMACNNIIINQAILPFGHEKEQSLIQGAFAALCLPLAAIAGAFWGLGGGAYLIVFMEFGVMTCLLMVSIKTLRFTRLNASGRTEKDNQENMRLNQ